MSKKRQILTIRARKNDVSEQLSKLDFWNISCARRGRSSFARQIASLASAFSQWLGCVWVCLSHWLSHDPQARFATGPAQRLGLLRAQASSKRQNLNESLLVGPKQAHSMFIVCLGIFKPLAKPIFVFKPLAKPTCHFDMISGHKKIETHKSWPSA